MKYNYAVSVGTGLGEDAALLHVPMKARGETGETVANYVDWAIRHAAQVGGVPLGQASKKPLCMGCTAAVLLNTMVALANKNGWDLEQFAALAFHGALDLANKGETEADTLYNLKRQAKIDALREAYDIRQIVDGGPANHTDALPDVNAWPDVGGKINRPGAYKKPVNRFVDLTGYLNPGWTYMTDPRFPDTVFVSAPAALIGGAITKEEQDAEQFGATFYHTAEERAEAWGGGASDHFHIYGRKPV